MTGTWKARAHWKHPPNGQGLCTVQIPSRRSKYLNGGDVMAIDISLQLNHVGRGPSVHKALIQHMVHPLQLPLPATHTPRHSFVPHLLYFASFHSLLWTQNVTILKCRVPHISWSIINEKRAVFLHMVLVHVLVLSQVIAG